MFKTFYGPMLEGVRRARCRRNRRRWHNDLHALVVRNATARRTARWSVRSEYLEVVVTKRWKRRSQIILRQRDPGGRQPPFARIDAELMKEILMSEYFTQPSRFAWMLIRFSRSAPTALRPRASCEPRARNERVPAARHRGCCRRRPRPRDPPVHHRRSTVGNGSMTHLFDVSRAQPRPPAIRRRPALLARLRAAMDAARRRRSAQPLPVHRAGFVGLWQPVCARSTCR